MESWGVGFDTTGNVYLSGRVNAGNVVVNGITYTTPSNNNDLWTMKVSR